jgi:FkbM family methyltransferase
LNVGANVGAFDVAVLAQGKSVPYALSAELNPFTFTRLAFNASANRMNTVRLCNGGIAGESGTMRFVARETSVTDCIFADEPAPGADFTEVSLFTLEQALANAGLSDKTFDLLKLDAEGAEFDIIEASSPELLRRFAHLVMEIHHPPPNRSPEKLYAKLKQSGFQGGDPTWTPADGHALRFWKRVA